MRVTSIIALALLMAAGTAVLAQEAEPAADEAQQVTPMLLGERVETDLVALYRFDNVVEGTIVPDLTADLGGLDLVISGGEVRDDCVHFPRTDDPAAIGLFSTEAASSVMEAVSASGRITIEAWVTPAAPDLTGPARIVSISRGTGERNFTLGQDRDAYALRLRTSATNQQGMPDVRTPGDTLAVGELQHVAATFDGQTVTIYVDGEAVADSADRAGTLGNWDESMLLAVGNETSGDRPWFGSVHLVAIYSIALSPQQINANFEAGL